MNGTGSNQLGSLQHSIVAQKRMVIHNASLWNCNFPLSLPLISTTNNKPLLPLPRPARCTGSERRGGTDVRNDLPPSEDNEPKVKQKDIWKLFTEAQQNILYLNKQRLMAMEELDRLKRDRVSLLEKIEQLEAKELPYNNEVLYNSSEVNRLSISSELLLRIDSMVLTGMVDNKEASELRRLVMDSRISIADGFREIMHKKDSELLIELRHFSNISKK